MRVARGSVAVTQSTVSGIRTHGPEGSATAHGPHAQDEALARHGVSREVPCSALKGETVPDSLPETPKSPPTRRGPPRGTPTKDLTTLDTSGHCHCVQSCLTLCDPMDCSPTGSSVHGIVQARTLEWDHTT